MKPPKPSSTDINNNASILLLRMNLLSAAEGIFGDFRSCALDAFEGYELQETDKQILDKLVVPVPAEESKRLEIVRQTDLLDSNKSDGGFDRISSLVMRLFEAPFAAITLVDIDRIWYKSLSGMEIEITDIPRDYGFDSFTILSDAPEVVVFNNLSADDRFVNNPFVSGDAKVKFYAGTPIIIEGVKIGALCVMDTAPREVSLEQKENLLDLGAAVSLIATQRRDAFLRLHNERTNIIVSMMHNLRTPLTSLNFAASLLSNEKAKVNSNSSTAQDNRLTNPISNHFPSTFTEINQALNQLNLLVDSTLCLGHTIIKCNAVAVGGNTMRNTSYVDCDLIAYLRDLYGKFSEDSLSCKINWVVDTKFLGEGRHVSYPDAILLILVSSIGYVSLEWKKITIKFSFTTLSSDSAVEFPEFSDKLLEGYFLIQLYPTDCVSTGEGESSGLVSSTLEYKYSSIEKILKSIGGGCKQTWGNSASSALPMEMESGIRCSLKMNLKRLSVAPQILHEFWVPCKIILNENSTLLNASNKNGGLRDKTITYGDGPGSPSSVTPKGFDHPKSNKRRGSIMRTSRVQLKVLVIEDTISVQKLLSRWLQKNGCLVTCANNGKIGLDLLKTSVYDIVLIDYLMPVMLGLTTMRLFQEWLNSGDDKDDHPIKAQNAEALLVGMSATALESEQEEGFQYGMHFFMPKPADLQILGMIIDAKKISLCNADAIESICDSTGTGGEPSSDATCDHSTMHSFTTVTNNFSQIDVYTSQSTKTHVEEAGEDAIVTLPVRHKGGHSSGGGANQWKLFRSFMQPRKIHPEVKT